MISSRRGSYDEALLHAEKAMRLSPRDIRSIGSFARTCAEFGIGHYARAAEWAKKTIEVTPEFPAAWLYVAMSLTHLDRLVEARAATDQILHLMPHRSLRLLRAAIPSDRPEETERRIDSLRMAGVPEWDLAVGLDRARIDTALHAKCGGTGGDKAAH